MSQSTKPQKKTLQHIAFIMDGNGRWASQKYLPRLMGHRKGVEKCEEICLYLQKLNIPYISLFAFSSENALRPEHEVNGLMALILEALEQRFQFFKQHNIAVNMVGDIDNLPKNIREAIQRIDNPKHPTTQINIALNYGGRWDIVKAIKHYAQLAMDKNINPQDISENELHDYFNHNNFPDIDLLFRSGREKRISNFMLWQLAYSELYFSDVLWPDITTQDIDEAIAFYHERERRFGRIPNEVAS